MTCTMKIFKYVLLLFHRSEYPVRTPLVRLLFCLMAMLMILWDFMLLITVLYFHMMIEKGTFGKHFKGSLNTLLASAGERRRSAGLVRSLQVYLQAKFLPGFARRGII